MKDERESEHDLNAYLTRFEMDSDHKIVSSRTKVRV